MSHQSHHFLELADIFSTLSDCLAFQPQQVAQLLLELMVYPYSRVELKELLQSPPFTSRQVTVPLSQGMDDGAFPADGLLSLFAKLHEVMVDHADDTEAVGYYFRIREASLDDVFVAGA